MLKATLFSFFLFFIISCGNNEENYTQTWYKPAVNISWQWQLNGDINTSYDVDLYDVDLFDTPKETIDKLHSQNKKVICYFSAGSYEDWRNDADEFPEEVLGKDLDGWEGEKWLDISKIDSLAPIMMKRFDLALQKGCDGVEVDNIDGYTNDTGFELTAQNQLDYNKFLSREAHKRGLSIALKNDLNQTSQLEPYFDFAINEQCNQFNECDKYQPFIKANKAVLNVEYNKSYIDDTNITKLCNYTNESNISTLILPIELNDSFRYDCNTYLFNSFHVGGGGASAFKFYDNVWLNSTDLIFGRFDDVKDDIVDFNETRFKQLSNYLQKGKYVTYWVTKDWQEEWFDLNKTQELMDAGKIPVFIYWYFGDKLMNGLDENDVKDYLIDVKRLKRFLSILKGDNFIILEPEFNKDSIISNPTNQLLFINAIKSAITILKQNDRKLSLCMMDRGSRDENSTNSCGYENCAYGDKEGWSEVKPIYNSLINDIDFISFQEMIGQFSRDDDDPGTWDDPNPKAHTDEEIGINHLAKRIDNFATYLKQSYNKPVFLPYITIATATWDDKDDDDEIDSDEINASGWVEKAENTYKDLNSSSLFGYAVMELFDNPTHDEGGYQYFIDNEYHLGIISSDINDSQITGNIKFKGKIIDYIFK